ncbi:MFS general substrate transporter [Lentithecium fluviatile CBS 122367]|uniref:MFS general substrate transporter n=1 Tax=Lentithecium fluviatile CBS 122367 TaxID=1168545 RepID=A0A6G1INS2_9PLEO|nr:MFS general substrate transporter [Lentithecium fluviatile CBS 122367]
MAASNVEKSDYATSADNAVPVASSTGQETSKKPFGFYMSFLSLVIMCLIVSLDATALAIAIPIMAHELHGTTLEAFWASISFILAVVIVQPIFTSISNVLGRIIPLYTSFLIFIVGSIVFAMAKDMSVLILGRVFQGIGAGGLDVLNEIILADITTLKERPMYIGLLSIPIAGGSILGPIIGGLFAQHAGWRWIGWINLPISALGILLVFFFLKLKAIPQSMREKLLRVDWIGIVLFSIGCTLFALPLPWAGAMYPWASWKTIFPLILGAAILVLFGWYESKPQEPMFPRRIFQTRTATMTLIAAALHGVVAYSFILYTPLFFQAVYFESPLKSAVSILPLSCVSVAFSVIAAVAVEMIRKYRFLILGSWVFAAVGAGLLALWDQSSSLAVKASFQVILGIGTGTLFSVLMIPIQACVHVDDMGIAAGILVSFRLFGGLLGLSMCSTVFTNVFEKKILMAGDLLGDLAALKNAHEAIAFIPVLRELKLPSHLLKAVVEAYQKSLVLSS